jgi:large conductance mechanosensitive channel
MGLIDDFRKFLEEYGVIGLAIAFVIGVAVKDFISATVDDIIMPIVGVFLPGGSWETAVATIGPVEFAIGHWIGALIDFLIIAFLVFMFARHILKHEEVKKI